MIFINGKIHRMNAPIIENGFVVTENGKIKSVGEMRDYNPPKEHCTVDLNGRLLLPGFIDAHTHLGMWEDSLGFEGDDGNEDTEPCTPHLRALDAVNPGDICFKEALAAGVTTVVTGPGSANPIGGTLLAMKTFGGRIDDMLIKDPLAIKFALGENPKTVYNRKNAAPVTRMATAALIREQLYKAKRYLQALEEAERDEELEQPEYDIKCEALIPLLKKQIPAHIHAHRADDIFTAVRLAKEFDLDYVLVHATQGHLIAEALAAEKVRILSGPLLCDRSKPELSGLTPASPGILSVSGVKTAIVTDHPVVPAQYLAVSAGLAVREGMDAQAALRAVTCDAAEILGLSDRLGAIAPGMDADFVVFAGDPFLLSAKPESVYVNGKQVV